MKLKLPGRNEIEEPNILSCIGFTIPIFGKFFPIFGNLYKFISGSDIRDSGSAKKKSVLDFLFVLPAGSRVFTKVMMVL